MIKTGRKPKQQIAVDVEREHFIEQLSELTNDELGTALRDRDLSDEALCALLHIDFPEPEEPPEPDPDISSSEVADLYDMISEGRKLEALELLYSLFPENLVFPTTQMRLAELRAHS